MPFQNHRYLPPLATPVISRYQTDYTIQDATPPKSYKSRNVTNLPPIAYSNCRRGIGSSSYSETYQGPFNEPAKSAKPPPYDFPSLDKFGTTTYRANFRKTNTLQLPLLPTSPNRRNNPHPPTMNNACLFPNRGYWVWPHRLIPMRTEGDLLTFRVSNDLLQDVQRGPYDIWQDRHKDGPVD